MNASASALTREGEVQSKIGKVRRFGRYARVVCSAIFGFGLVGGVIMLVTIVFGPIPGPDSDTSLLGLATPQLKLWMFLVKGVLIGTVLTAVYQLYRLFGNLAAGTIYTPENVRRVWRVGLLGILGAALCILIPAASNALVASGFIDASLPIKELIAFPSFSESLGDFIAAGLVLLASWIMDVGLYEKDHADALQRDAELVI